MTPPAILFTARAPSPCFIIDLERLRQNAAILETAQNESGAKILLALKAFSAFAAFPLLSAVQSGPLCGVCASSVDEARLGKESFGGEVHAFAAAWSQEEMEELLETADHVVFNSLAQLWKHAPRIDAANAGPRRKNPIEYGLRVNPEHSEGAVAIYNPCAPGSRLGIRKKALERISPADVENVAGLHFHTLCEQDAAPLARTLESFEKNFAPFIPGRKWLNWGGGHHITKPGYDLDLLIKLVKSWKQKYACDIYLEPGEAVALNAGWLTAEVLDVVEADIPVAILDASAACHMPDVLEMPYKPEVWLYNDGRIEKADNGLDECVKIRLAGKSCLAGDVIGEYGFSRLPQAGDRLVFGDMAIYSMVKTNTFNGLRLPSIALYDPDWRPPLRIIREFGYDDFKTRLS